jgi:hypothetical protein
MLETLLKRLNLNKTLEAALRGYIYFRVNDKIFFLYNSALKERKSISESKHVVTFDGYHIFKGWKSFYYSTRSIF